MQLPELDTIDLQILRLLQKDASLTNKEIAFELDKSVATIHERIRKLKEQGYIKKIVALLDRKKNKQGADCLFAGIIKRPYRANLKNV